MEIDLTTHDATDGYRVITSLIVPRPIGWISTRHPDGTVNLAPYSYFNAVCSTPPVLMFSAGSSAGNLKDTPRNATASEEFVMNLATEETIQEMDKTSAKLPDDESEFEHAGLTPVESTTVRPPRVAEAAANLECKLYETLTIYTNTVVFGEVTYIHIDNSLITNGDVDATKVNAIGRLGGPYYTKIDRSDYQRSY